MVRTAAACPAPRWHRVFLAMLPKIISYAKSAFRNLDPEARAEAVQNVVANSCAAVAGLARRGKLDPRHPTVLAQYGIKQTRDHRISPIFHAVRQTCSRSTASWPEIVLRPSRNAWSVFGAARLFWSPSAIVSPAAR